MSQTDLLLTMTWRLATMASGSYGHQLLELPALALPMEMHMYWYRNVENDSANRLAARASGQLPARLRPPDALAQNLSLGSACASALGPPALHLPTTPNVFHPQTEWATCRLRMGALATLVGVTFATRLSRRLRLRLISRKKFPSNTPHQNPTMTTTSLATGTPDLLATLDRGVLTLTLNRPDARNAMTRAMNQALQAQLASAELDPAVRCIVITGAGKGFCAGGDVKNMAATGDGTVGARTIDEAIHQQRINQRETAGRLFKMPKPTIAALPGPAAGAGLSLALACDLRVMASTALMTTAFARVGFSGDYGGTYFMTQLVGAAKARELYLLSPRVSADEALRLGLTNWVCAPEDLAARTSEIAHTLANGPTVAYRYMKENLNRAMAGGVDECLDLEATHHVHCGQTEDHREASRAFVEKREPVFKGR